MCVAKKNTNKILESTETLPTTLTQQLPTEMNVSPTEVSIIKAACLTAGIGIDQYVCAIRDALQATKTTVDKHGDEHIEDDHAMRLKAALMGLELEGYIKVKGTTTENKSYTQINVKWGE